MPFKRTHSTLESGDYRRPGSSREEFLPKQPVRIVCEVQGDEDAYVVELATGARYLVDTSDLHPMPHSPETNTEFVTRLMEEGGTTSGALIQPFVLEAIRIYAEQVRAGPASHFGNAMISGEAWKRAAEDALAMLQDRAL